MIICISGAFYCTGSEKERFQKFQPTSNTALADLFNQTPALKSAITKIDPVEFDTRLNDMLSSDYDVTFKVMNKIKVFIIFSSEQPDYTN